MVGPGCRDRGLNLVIDNDPQQSARDVVQQHRSHPAISYVVEPEPGLAAVRNRALDEADADLLVMLHDDERPQEGWLSALLQIWWLTGAALVSGRVQVEFDAHLDPWVAAGASSNLPTGAPISVASSNNWLLDLAQIRAAGVRSDPRYGLSGGRTSSSAGRCQRRGGRSTSTRGQGGDSRCGHGRRGFGLPVRRVRPI